MSPFLMIVVLGITQVIGYGTLYHSYAVLAPAMAHGLDWPTPWVFGVLSGAFLLSGLAAPRLGRWVDDVGAATVMVIGSCACALALFVCAVVPGHLAFVVATVAIQLAAMLVQYNTSFTFLVQVSPRSAQRNITYLTLIVGFASTIFWPITTSLHGFLTWQQVYLGFAATHAAVCVPCYLWLRSTTRPRFAARETPVAGIAPADVPEPMQPGPEPVEGLLLPVNRPAASALMLTGFALQSFVLSALLIHMLPLFYAIGLGPAGVTIAMLLGPAQLVSRAATMFFDSRRAQPGLAIVSSMLMPCSLLLLLALLPTVAGAVAFTVVFGLGAGLTSIVQGTLPLVLFGSAGYGARAGQITSAKLLTSAASPFLFALLLDNAGVTWTLFVTGCVGGSAVLAFFLIARLLHRQSLQLACPAPCVAAPVAAPAEHGPTFREP